LTKVVKDQPGGQVHLSFIAQAILTTSEFLQCDADIVDTLFYEDDKGDTRDIYPLKKKQVKNLRDFLLDRSNRLLSDALDPTAFTFNKAMLFITIGSTVTRPPAPVVPASITTATQVQADLDKTLLNNWERGKHDHSDYTPLKDKHIFVSWLKEQLNVVEMQGYTRLFDPTFVLSSVRP